MRPTIRSAAIPTLLVFVALVIGLLRLVGPADELYPVSGDSQKYQTIAHGFSHLYSHPVDGFSLWLRHNATESDLQRYGFDSWVLQHAPAYTAFLGFFYLLPGNDETTGRVVGILFFAAGAVFLYLLGKDLFSRGAGLAAALIYLFWPSNWTYAPAILTEVPVGTAALAASWLMLRTAGTTRLRSWILGGVMVGLLVLTKTTLRFLAVPWILLEFLFEKSQPTQIRVRRMVGRLAGWGGVQLLWLLFLYGFQLSANPLAESGEDWLWIYRGNQLADRGWETVGIGDAATPELRYGFEHAARLPQAEQRSAAYREAFLETVRQKPIEWISLVGSKVGIFWWFPATKINVRAGPLDLPPPARVQPTLVLAALIGLALVFGAGAWRVFPALVPLYLTALHAATHLVGRYNIPATPFVFLYACGAASLVLSGLLGDPRKGIETIRERFRRAAQPWMRSVSAGLGVAVCLILLALGRPYAMLAPWVVCLTGWPFLAGLLGCSTLGRVRALAVLLPLTLLITATRINDPDPDEDRIRLDRPGDGVSLALTLPDEVTPDRFESAEVLLDLLPSPRGTMTVAVQLSGREIARFSPRLPSGPEAFTLDEQIHGEQDRCRRVLRSVESHLVGAVRKRPRMADVGYDYYRQWYRVTIDPALAFETSEPTLEVVLLESTDAWLDVYVDRDVPSYGTGERVIEMPALFENAYELSSYKFDALATNRRLADARLVRPAHVASTRRSASFFDRTGERRAVVGEPRLRLRGRLPGGYGVVIDESGREVQAYVTDPAQAVRMLRPSEIRRLQSDRDRYFSGAILF